MPRATRSDRGAEIPAYGIFPLHADGDAAANQFYQLRFGARIFLRLPSPIYKGSKDFWDRQGLKADDPVVARVIEAPATDLVEMLLKHVDAAHDEAAVQLG